MYRARMQDRSANRHDVTILGHYRAGTGLKREVTMLDLSESGCRFHDRRTVLRLDAALTIRIGALGPFDATVRWIERDTVGVQFARPIYGPVFEHIRTQLDNSNWRPPA